MLTKITISEFFITLGITWIKVNFLPSLNFMFLLGIAVLFDLITGVIKAWIKHEYITSTGLRRTISKLVQYGGFIVVSVILLNISVGEKKLSDYEFIIDGAYVLIILIELLSICENLVEINPDSKVCEYVIYPVMKMIRGRFPNKHEAIRHIKKDVKANEIEK